MSFGFTVWLYGANQTKDQTDSIDVVDFYMAKVTALSTLRVETALVNNGQNLVHYKFITLFIPG